MRICGIDIKASEAILVLIDCQGDEILFIFSPTKRVSLIEDDSQGSVKLFFETIGAFLRSNHVDLVAIKKRNKKGEYAGGPTTFKIEGLIQMTQNCDVRLVSPQTVAAFARKHTFELPKNLLKYQSDAYLTACCSAMK